MCQRLLIKDPPDLNEQRKYALAPYDPPEKDSTSMFAAFEEAKKSRTFIICKLQNSQYTSAFYRQLFKVACQNELSMRFILALNNAK